MLATSARVVVRQNGRPCLNVSAGHKHLLDSIAETRKIPAVDLHQANIDVVALADGIANDLGAVRRRLDARDTITGPVADHVDVHRERIPAALNADDVTEGRGADVGRTSGKGRVDHRDSTRTRTG